MDQDVSDAVEICDKSLGGIRGLLEVGIKGNCDVRGVANEDVDEPACVNVGVPLTVEELRKAKGY